MGDQGNTELLLSHIHQGQADSIDSNTSFAGQLGSDQGRDGEPVLGPLAVGFDTLQCTQTINVARDQVRLILYPPLPTALPPASTRPHHDLTRLHWTLDN